MFGRCRPLVRRAVVLAGSTAVLGSNGAALASSSDAALGSLWSTAVDGWIDVPGSAHMPSTDGVIYMSPAGQGASAAVGAALPKVVAKSIIFSLTASNPMGEDAPAEWNRLANQALEVDIRKLDESRGTSPRAWWRSFGFNVNEGWREDGFSLAFAPEERAYAMDAVLRLAHKYRQAAIYVYKPEAGGLMREVVWLDRAKQASLGGQRERVLVLAKPPATALARREWQPAEGEAADREGGRSPSFSPKGRETSIWISPEEVRSTLARMIGR